MELLTDNLKLRLLANGRDANEDHVPVVKFFHAAGAATWLISELDEDEDTMFGLADLGFGEPELGYVSLSELKSLQQQGLRIERDLHFEGRVPITKYAEAARRFKRIVDL